VNILSTSLGGLDLLASAVIILDTQGRIAYANAAAETLLENSFKVLHQQRLSDLFMNGDRLTLIFEQAKARHFDEKREDLLLERAYGGWEEPG
jgi:two-component system nitrogen regulation sensor histidine kinase GlnL